MSRQSLRPFALDAHQRADQSPDFDLHEAAELLMHNETYINAIQRASVSLYHLGFTDMTMRSQPNLDVPLKPVVPKEDQVEFLDNIDRGLKFMSLTHSKRSLRKAPRQSMYSRNKKKFSLTEAQKILGKTQPRPDPFRDGLVPAYAKPSMRMLETERLAREEEAERRRRMEALQASGVHRDIVKDGIKHVYDPLTGKLVPEHELKSPKARASADAPLSARAPTAPAKASDALLERTSRYVDALRKSIEDERTPRRLPRIPESLTDWPTSLLRTWPEYALLEPGDALLTVEHCHSCRDHEAYTQHCEEKYLTLTQRVIDTVRAVAQHFGVRFFCQAKPIATPSVLQRSTERSVRGSMLDPAEYRVGALEVQLAIRMFDHDTFFANTLHSKLHTGQWPRLELLERHAVQLLQQAQFEQVRPLPVALVEAMTAPSVMERLAETRRGSRSPGGPRARLRPSSALRPPPLSLGAPSFDQKVEPVRGVTLTLSTEDSPNSSPCSPLSVREEAQERAAPRTSDAAAPVPVTAKAAQEPTIVPTPPVATVAVTTSAPEALAPAALPVTALASRGPVSSQQLLTSAEETTPTAGSASVSPAPASPVLMLAQSQPKTPVELSIVAPAPTFRTTPAGVVRFPSPLTLEIAASECAVTGLPEVEDDDENQGYESDYERLSRAQSAKLLPVMTPSSPTMDSGASATDSGAPATDSGAPATEAHVATAVSSGPKSAPADEDHQRDSLGEAILSLNLMPASTLPSVQSLDPEQAREAVKSVRLLKQMLQQDEEDDLHKSVDMLPTDAEADEEFWRHVDSSMLSPERKRSMPAVDGDSVEA